MKSVNFCPATNIKGVSLLHGNGDAFAKETEPRFKVRFLFKLILKANREIIINKNLN